MCGRIGDVLDLAQDGDQARRPVHAVDDVGLEAEQRQALEHGARVEREAAPVVRIRPLVLGVQVAPAQELRVVDQHDREVAEQPLVDLDGLLALTVAHAHLADGLDLGHRGDAEVTRPRHEHADVRAFLTHRARQRFRDLGQARLARQRLQLRCCERDSQ